MVPYALAVFTSAFLLFQVQPLIAKYILPWFGGGPAVWTTSMLFFQVFLLAGYAYAHFSVRYFRLRVQVGLHLALLLLALTQLPITPMEILRPTAADAPTLRILLLLGATIGLPYLALSSTAPLIQAWFSRTHSGRSPYRLYALSNIASLLALLTYPFVVEPSLTRPTQVTLWSLGFGFFVVACSYCAVRVWRYGTPQRSAGESDGRPETRPPGRRSRLLWLALSATAAVLLLAVTNQLTQDLAAVPFLWVLPLSLYLLSFIICFDNERWYHRPVFVGSLIPAMVAVIWIMFLAERAPVLPAIGVYSAALFVCCMVCHGELSRLKPNPTFLTGYYLMIALGGALGGVLVAIVMPALVNDFFELHLGLLAMAGLTLIVLATDKESVLARLRPAPVWAALIAAYLLMGVALHRQARNPGEDIIAKSRNFYGVVTVGRDHGGTNQELLWLRHGTSYHGAQFTGSALRYLPTGYYSPSSGAALALGLFPHPRRFGFVGMGVGTLTAYGEEGDYIRIYEIDPEVKRIAETYFTYLADSRARVEVILGDARLSLERDPPQAFDVLIVDAFTSDAIPVHLLTKEAFSIYERHIKPDGVIAILISSWHFDFEPVIRRLADHVGMKAALIVTPHGPGADWGARWMLVTRNRQFLEHDAIRGASRRQVGPYQHIRLWTDDYTSPFQILEDG